MARKPVRLSFFVSGFFYTELPSRADNDYHDGNDDEVTTAQLTKSYIYSTMMLKT